uniref:Piriformospora indica-insensitive protein 2 n=1 Tax=Aegilops tauschii subsp. strangulata TaxID=200361 RepID=A0A453DYP0_AEGTS
MRRARGGRLLLPLAALFLALLLLSGCAAEGEDEEGSPVAAEEPEAPMEDKEKAALYAAIGGFVGKAWNGSGLFPDPCGQTPIQGVSCDLFNGLWYPTVVSIGPVLDNSLQCAPDARFSPQLFDLRRLKSLTFYACFPAANPTAIPAASWDKLAGTLETLEFRSNPGLSGAIPASLGRLGSLQSLVLVDNNLTGAVPPELGGLAKLRRLVLSRNGLSGPVPATLGNDNTQLRRLDELLIMDMSKNSLTGSLPPSLGGLKGLLKMDLSNNRLDGRIPPELAGLESLTLLDLRNNSLTGGLPGFVLGMAALQDLLLSSNPLLGGTLMQRGWEKMASLATLDLSNVGLAGAIPESMAAMPRLRLWSSARNRSLGIAAMDSGMAPARPTLDRSSEARLAIFSQPCGIRVPPNSGLLESSRSCRAGMPSTNSGSPPVRLLFRRSSSVRLSRPASSGGMRPSRRLLLRSILSSPLSPPSDGGRDPVREFLLMSTISSGSSRRLLLPSVAGTGPDSPFPDSTSRRSFASPPSSGGTAPVRLLSTRTRDCRLARRPRDAGMAPARPGFERNSSVSRVPESLSQFVAGMAVGLVAGKQA